MDVAVPTRIVSEDPSLEKRFPADYPILAGCYWTTESIKYRRLSGRPRIQGRPLNGFRPHFPIKAPTRQMLYPLSYRGTFKLRHVSKSKNGVNRTLSPDQTNKKRSPSVGDLLVKIPEIKLTPRECVPWFQRTRDGR